MFRYRLRTLLIAMAVGPPMLAAALSTYWSYRAAYDIATDRDLEEWSQAPTEFAHNRKHRIIWVNEFYED